MPGEQRMERRFRRQTGAGREKQKEHKGWKNRARFPVKTRLPLWERERLCKSGRLLLVFLSLSWVVQYLRAPRHCPLFVFRIRPLRVSEKPPPLFCARRARRFSRKKTRRKQVDLSHFQAFPAVSQPFPSLLASEQRAFNHIAIVYLESELFISASRTMKKRENREFAYTL